MPSFSPYNLSARFARSAVGRLNRIWGGRVSKTASTQRRTRARRTESSDAIHPGPATHSRQWHPGDSDATEHHDSSDESLAIKQEDDDYSPAAIYGGPRSHHVDVQPDEEDSFSDESGEDGLPSPQDGAVTPDDLDGRDEPLRSIEDYDESQFGVGTSPSLRGGSRIQGSADGVERDRSNEDDDGDEDDDDEEGSETQINMDDYYESDDDFDIEYDVDREDIAGYRVERTKVKGIATWPKEVARAHKTIALRGMYPLMPSSWNWDLVDHPFVEGLFVPADSDKKVLFQEQSNRSRATRALRNLFELHIRICAYRQDGLHDKIADLIEKEIRAYNLAVEKDVKLRGSYGYVSPIFIVKFSNLNMVPVEERDMLSEWVHRQAMQACQARVRRYHADWAESEVDSYPRFIYTFVIIQQTVLIWAIDTDPTEMPEPYILASLDMSKRTAWLETSLAIAITIHLAKESICVHRGSLPPWEEEDDDPDA